MNFHPSIGKTERVTQNRVIALLQNELGYEYLGNWQDGRRTLPVEPELLKAFLTQTKGYSDILARKAIDEFLRAVELFNGDLYNANKTVYHLLRYGVKVNEETGKMKETVWFIDWKNPQNNRFAVAEEVSVQGKTLNRPDLVLYVNGIALGVLELKRSTVSVGDGIRQNIGNQQADYIPNFFTTIQFVLAGNDTQGLRYGTVGTKEKYFLEWKEENEDAPSFDYLLDRQLRRLCLKERFLELIHDFVVFEKGVKKLCRPHQYFGVKAACERVKARQGGIIWHTQGSGKSLTMIWLAKWILENINDSRVLIITDREELDAQIEGQFLGVEEQFHRAPSGKKLLDALNTKEKRLIGSLVHKFGRNSDEGDFEAYVAELKNNTGLDFKAKGDIYVFVDECHRTQSGKLHEAMKTILPNAVFIGFTGTPLLKKDKQKSIEIFGAYIGAPYKFDEAVADGVVLDLLYEARDVEQFIANQDKIDVWFDAKTRALNDSAKTELKKKWGTMQKVLGSKARLEKIVIDIITDFDLKPRLSTGEGNALLVSGSVYQACRYYELFQANGFKECAIITSYQPNHTEIKSDETGEGLTENLKKYEVYKRMLNGKAVEDFEKEVKAKFKDAPSQMKLLIVVDKLLTGFDAPSATYLYIDKSMQDHGLFQAICRVNRVDTESKQYGYIVDYKDLFLSLQKSITDYTSTAFDQFDAQDVKGLLTDRLTAGKERLETALETVRALCEPVRPPKDELAYIQFFCGETSKATELKAFEEKRRTFYTAVVSLIRAYANIANDMEKIGFTEIQAENCKQEVQHFARLMNVVKQASGDFIDLKSFEPDMRQLMDLYLDAKSSKTISNLQNKTLTELVVQLSAPVEEATQSDKKRKQDAAAETIENNVRKVIVEKSQTNPVFYEKMSKLLDELIRRRKEETLEYEEYLKEMLKLAEQITQPTQSGTYPPSLTTAARRALFDNLNRNEALTLQLDEIIQTQKQDGWRGNAIKEKKLRGALSECLPDKETLDELMKIIKAQYEY